MPNPNLYGNNLYGGLRARAIRSSIFHFINDGLTALGWMATGKNFTPVTFLDEIPIFTGNETIALNTLALIDGEDQSEDAELGAYFGKDTWTFSVDFYAENDSVGLAVQKDIQRMLEGRQPGIGYVFPVIPIYDYSLSVQNVYGYGNYGGGLYGATPAQPAFIGHLDVEDVMGNRVSGPQTWQRYWYVVTCSVVDFNLT